MKNVNTNQPFEAIPSHEYIKYLERAECMMKKVYF